MDLWKIPAQRKKRLVILKWLARKFDFDVTYTERQVSDSIKRHHAHDWATLRRELIASKLM